VTDAAPVGATPSIRPERPEDHEAIAAVVEAAFGSPAEARLVEAIRSSPEYIADLALVAEVGGRVVGHVMVSGARLVDGDTERAIVMLSPLAVAPDLHRSGIGSALVREVTARTDARGEPFVVLEGNPAYYGRLGFEPAADHGITLPLPSWAPTEAAQVMRLSADDPTLTGHVVYPPAFDDVTEH
jgi:putative acetyltransferase